MAAAKNMSSYKYVFFLFVALIGANLPSNVARADGSVPMTLTVQGYLTDSADDAVNGSTDFQADIYIYSTSVWRTRYRITVVDGQFTIVLGSAGQGASAIDPSNGAPLPVASVRLNESLFSGIDNASPVEVGISVKHGAVFEEVKRYTLGVSPFAVRAASVGNIMPPSIVTYDASRNILTGNGQPIIDKDGNFLGSVAGLSGATGAVGATGSAGSAGPTGAPGPAGSSGAPGAPGAPGGAGTNGTNGTNGAPGPTGLTGPTGAPGTAGTAGSNGATGSPGPTGLTGPTGAGGASGATGATGATGGAGTNGANGTNGATGAPGSQGPTGPMGATGTSGTIGANGATGGNGPTGPNGSIGPTGSVGANGATGAPGTNGSNGATGGNGPTGPGGSQGTAGVSGPTGGLGPTGPQGAPGTAGSTGASGVASAAGSANQLQYNNGSNAMAANANLVWSSSQLGVGTSSPVATLDVNGTARLKSYTTEPYTCDAAHAGAAAFNFQYHLCVCNGSAWAFVDHLDAGCSWNTAGQPTAIYTGSGTGFNQGSNFHIYTFTNGNQSFVVPAGVTSITVKAWGAGGGSLNTAGGAGGFTTSSLTVTPGETLNVIVGAAGLGGQQGNYGNASGGGRSAVQRSSVDILTAGGGGGGAYVGTGAGGGGGGLVGGSCYNSSTNPYCGGGGTQTNGGAPGTGGPALGAGTQYLGGINASYAGNNYGGGGGGAGGGAGGGGYYGGGAGGNGGSGGPAGGGGSSFGPVGAALTAATGATAVGTSDSDYSGGAGIGGAASGGANGNAGGNGLLVIRW